jgi:plastocyanin
MRTLPLVALVGVALWTSCGASGSGPVLTDKVRMFDIPGKPESEWGYDPREIRVPSGTTVTFTNTGVVFHTVTADAGRVILPLPTSASAPPGRAFDIGADAGVQVTIRFDTPGVWPYHCGVHPDMKGVVHVCDGACR